MKHFAAAAAALVLAGSVQAANAQPVIYFNVGPSAPQALPSADVPNASGSIRLPETFTTPPAFRQQLSFPALQGLWQRAGASYGIPWQVLASINRIESNFGQNMGPSSAGAVGWMQFMPSTWDRWGMDGDADGISDPWDPEDAVFAAARYLAAAGGATDMPRAIFAYNHAQWYVDEVLAGARLYGAEPGAIAFALDRGQVEVDAAEQTIGRLSAELLAAQRVERRLARRAAQLQARADAVDLLSDRLALEQRAGQAAFRLAGAAEETARLADELEQAEQDLERARAGALTGSLALGAAGLTPSFAGDYVFPVGGGPSVVSVSHTHHDYPAADIAAPSGSPLFALTDGVVVGAWPQGNGNCGIGFSLLAGDGREWTYCHLSYLDPAVVQGAVLAAGVGVGLVGSTGHSTGPHLHLQLQPALSYPQEEPWFQALAGTAFSWQDADPHAHGAVFAVAAEPGTVAFAKA